MHPDFPLDTLLIRDEVRQLLKYATLASAGGHTSEVGEMVERAGDLIRHAAEVARMNDDDARELPP